MRQALLFRKSCFFLKNLSYSPCNPLIRKYFQGLWAWQGVGVRKTDFVAGFGEANIHRALSTLARAGTIRRVCHGVYDYPRYRDLLEPDAEPGVDQVARALARKFNWRIQPSGDAALNLLDAFDAGACPLGISFRWSKPRV